MAINLKTRIRAAETWFNTSLRLEAMVRNNCFDSSIGNSKPFGVEVTKFKEHNVQKNNSEAIPCPADSPRKSFVGLYPKHLITFMF